MFPYFNENNWNYFSSHEAWLTIDTMNLDDILFPDIVGFIHSMLTTKNTWKYWTNHSNEILDNLANCYISIDKLIEDLLQACVYYNLYNSPYYYKKSLKRKTRMMWKTIMIKLDENKVIIPKIFNRYILKQQLYERLHYMEFDGPLWINELPYSLLKDIFDLYSDRINIFTGVNYIILTENITVLRQIYPDITIRVGDQYLPVTNDNPLQNENNGDNNDNQEIFNQI
jgi:transposase